MICNRHPLPPQPLSQPRPTAFVLISVCCGNPLSPECMLGVWKIRAKVHGQHACGSEPVSEGRGVVFEVQP